MNNPRHVGFYSDKNSYDILLRDIRRPLTLAKYAGATHVMNERSEPLFGIDDDEVCLSDVLGGVDRIVVKPSVDSCSGIGVQLFKLKGNQYVNKQRECLTTAYLRTHFSQFVIQKAVNQSAFMTHFCSTSVNTIRACMYKSVLTGSWEMTASVLRIGKEGSEVDNAHAGGVMARIDL